VNPNPQKLNLISIFTKPFQDLKEMLNGLLLKCMSSERLWKAWVDSLENVPSGDSFLREVIERSARLGGITAGDVVIPRKSVLCLNVEDVFSENYSKMVRSGHTRFPLCEGDLDRTIGIVHIKDLFRAGIISSSKVELRKLARRFLEFSVNDSIDYILKNLLGAKTHMAIVMDDFGGVIGVVTLESVLEYFVGQIQDEFDAEEPLIRRESERGWYVLGQAALHDVEAIIGTPFNHTEVATVSGLLTAEFGRIPESGEVLELSNLKIKIIDADKTRVISAYIYLKTDQEND
jgi:CBS domain containing-hemolysin-like protein